jgi:DNA-directed RNA polymerase specialized sigma24 family protein
MKFTFASTTAPRNRCATVLISTRSPHGRCVRSWSTTLAATLELDRALCALELRDSDLARLVEWHFFAGLNFHEIARETGRHERTVRRDWELARAFLQRELAPAQS